VWGLGGQGVELFDRGEAFCPVLPDEWAFLQHVHELDPDQRGVGRCQRREAEHGTRDPFDGTMILFNHSRQVFDLPNHDVGAVCLVVAIDGGFIGVTAVNSDGLGDSVTADRLRQKP